MGLCPQRTDDPSIQDTLPSQGHHTCAMDVCLVQKRFALMRVGLDYDHSKIDQHRAKPIPSTNKTRHSTSEVKRKGGFLAMDIQHNRQQERLLMTNSAPVDELEEGPGTMRVSCTCNNSSQTFSLGKNHATQLRYPLSQHPHPASHPSARYSKMNSVPRSKARRQKDQKASSAIMPLIEPIKS